MAIEAVLSHSVFYKQDSSKNYNHAYVAAYWQIDPMSLSFFQLPDSSWQAKIKTDIFFISDTGVLFSDHYILATTPLSIDKIRQQNITDMREYDLPPGRITMTVTLTEVINPAKKIMLSDTIVIPRKRQNAFYSDVELLDTLYPSAVNSVFLKDGRQQVPLCANFYDDYKKNLHYYAELYNADKVSSDVYPLHQRVFISKGENESVVLDLTARDTVLKKPFQAVYGSFPLAALPSGNYYLNVNLEDKDDILVASKAVFIQRYNANPELADTSEKRKKNMDSLFENVTYVDLSKTFVAKYSMAQLKAILKMIAPKAKRAELHAIDGFLKHPDEFYMRYYVYNFFHEKNPDDPGAAWKQYADVVREVNKRFSVTGTPGYETDRGEIYLRYGKPTEIITVENEDGTLPYEIWQYSYVIADGYRYSNALFLFYRPSSMITGFELLNSTVPGEIHNGAWRSYLYLNGGGDNTNARAEQYFGGH